MKTMNAPARPRFLAPAGNTRERIDAVRDWGNVFTGNTGYEIARALSSAGDVDLLTSNRIHLADLAAAGAVAAPAPSRPSLRALGFITPEELKTALSALMDRGRYDAVFMTAAVADYRPDR